MTAPRWLSEFPETVRASSGEPDRQYVVMPQRFAVHGPPPAGVSGAVVEEFEADDRTITICHGDPDATITAARGRTPRIVPVYALDADVDVAVPTGRIFVRFAAGVRAADRSDALARAGYELVEVLSYAPNAAWVRAADGEIATALANLDRLEAVEAVENVEPQMLRAMGRRSDTG